MKKIYLFPRYSGNENSDWYQKMEMDIRNCTTDTEIIPLTFPNWDKPDIRHFLTCIGQIIPAHKIDADCFFMGHSIGCKAALFYLDALSKKNKDLRIGGFIAVAGWWTIDKPWHQLKPWINHKFDFENIKQICNHKILSLLSDNDPFTSDFKANKNDWENHLNAEVRIVPNARHFNENDGFEHIKTELLNFIK